MQKPSSNPISSLLSSGPENTSLDPSIQHNLYLDTFPPSSRELKKSSEWFAFKRSNPKFLTSVAEFRNLPISNVPEVAFVGRSNVGKSSLLNAMVGANFFKKNAGLAQTSKRPGCTKTMNLYGIGGARLQKPGNGEKFRKIVGPGGLVIVDLPGYGKGGRMEWGEEIIKFFVQRKQLRRVFVLLDSHIGMRDGEKNPIKQNDRDLLELLRQNGVSHQVILSKIDGVHIPEAKKLRRLASRQGDNTSQKITPKDGKGDLHLMMKRARDVTKPARGGAALGEVLGVSSELEVDGNLFGMNGVRVAVLRAVGIEMGKQSMGDIQVQEDAQV
ncbi:hypothetical protein EJ04DRAFT_431853 [Polyplosphaeria fusca]|uniref:EngB-type G domain-containing protein n=1 Tax=Polyplosphaeria fusca TaxID=682080 RepID=A0A9P4R2U1_9PLEO|nr:hypothetical protein EJ04DRAFT_431853 [Polyplosphaeria fusca]